MKRLILTVLIASFLFPMGCGLHKKKGWRSATGNTENADNTGVWDEPTFDESTWSE